MDLNLPKGAKVEDEGVWVGLTVVDMVAAIKLGLNDPKFLNRITYRNGINCIYCTTKTEAKVLVERINKISEKIAKTVSSKSSDGIFSKFTPEELENN